MEKLTLETFLWTITILLLGFFLAQIGADASNKKLLSQIKQELKNPS